MLVCSLLFVLLYSQNRRDKNAQTPASQVVQLAIPHCLCNSEAPLLHKAIEEFLSKFHLGLQRSEKVNYDPI